MTRRVSNSKEAESDRGRIRRFVSTTTGPYLFGAVYHRFVFFPSASWYLTKELKDCGSVMDLGCGPNSILRYLKSRPWSVGVEAWGEAIGESSRKRIHDAYVKADITNLPFASKSIDAAVLIEVIEHLTKTEGEILVSELSRVVRKKIIITTPNGFLPQDADSNPYQVHKSGWEIGDLVELGFSGFRGLGGFKILGRTYKKQVDFALVQSLPQKLAYHRPEKANGLICTKRIEGVGKER